MNKITAALKAVSRLKYSVDSKQIIDLKIIEDALKSADRRNAELNTEPVSQPYTLPDGWLVTHNGKDYFYRNQSDALNLMSSIFKDDKPALMEHVVLRPQEPIKDNRLNSGPDADDYYVGYQSGWNECRDAMINAEPVSQPYTLPVAWVVSFSLPGTPGSDFTATFWSLAEKNHWVSLHESAGFSVDVEPLYSTTQEPTK